MSYCVGLAITNRNLVHDNGGLPIPQPQRYSACDRDVISSETYPVLIVDVGIKLEQHWDNVAFVFGKGLTRENEGCTVGLESQWNHNTVVVMIMSTGNAEREARVPESVSTLPRNTATHGSLCMAKKGRRGIRT